MSDPQPVITDAMEAAIAPAPVAEPLQPVAHLGDLAAPTESATVQPSDHMEVDQKDTILTGNHSLEPTDSAVIDTALQEKDPNDADMEFQEFSGEDDASEYEPEADTPPPKKKLPKSAKSTPAKAIASPKTPANASARLLKTPLSRVRSGRVDKSGASPANSTLECPVTGCEQKFSGRNPRQSLWHHLKYYATRGLPDRVDFEKAHGEAHADMKREAEPKGTPVERNRISSSDYRKKNPEKAKTSARLSNFRARARKKGITDEREIEECVAKWEKEWQEKQAKEASEYFSGILLSAFE